MRADWSHSHPVLARWLGRQAAPGTVPASPCLMALEDIRGRHLALLHDCDGAALTRVRRSVDAARTATDLWMLRGELYQVVSCSHGEPEAKRRIGSLAPAFEGWVPPDALQRARASAA